MHRHYWLAASIGALFLNHLLTAVQPNEHYPEILRDVIFNGVRFGVLAFVGFLVVRFYRKTTVVAALIAAVVFGVDHLLLKPLYLLIILTGRETIEFGWLVRTYTVLLPSFLLFSPVAMLFGAIGGMLARVRYRNAPMAQ